MKVSLYQVLKAHEANCQSGFTRLLHTPDVSRRLFPGSTTALEFTHVLPLFQGVPVTVTVNLLSKNV
jgi:hypothetical protein